MKNTLYRIYINNELVCTESLGGLAFINYATAKLSGDARIEKWVLGNDPVLTGIHVWNDDDGCFEYDRPVPCTTGGDCPFTVKPCGLDNQCNALRIEIMSPSNRCGMRLKSNRVGGRWDDYHLCCKS